MARNGKVLHHAVSIGGGGDLRIDHEIIEDAKRSQQKTNDEWYENKDREVCT